jgi:hypothetical protein
VTTPERDRRRQVGWLATVVVFALYGGVALSVDFKTAAGGFVSDEATYYLMAYSAAFDGDLEYRREDLERGFHEFPSGPSGIFLKRGTDVTGVGLSPRPPFIEFRGVPDPDTSRLYYGKSFVYPVIAAPFVRLLGTNGFLWLNALLVAAAFFATYLFASARSGATVGLLWAGAFVFASVVPVFIVWTMPEVFNWSLGAIAYVLWLYKYVSPESSRPSTKWLRGTSSDLVAAALVGVLTFSKVTNVLLLIPPVVWFLVQRRWQRAALVTVVAGLIGVAGFGANVVSSGEWNYQGGDRATCYARLPFDRPDATLDVCAERGRNEALGNVIFDREVFWSNLRANAAYFFVGRTSGLLPYYAPLVFAGLAMLVTWRRTERWQWIVLAGILAHGLLFIVALPYSYFGGGGTVGNRYFMGAYGPAAVLVPFAIGTRWLAAPWLVGSLFVAKIVLTPFQTSMRPGDHSKSGPYRWLPIELTNMNALPINTDPSRVRLWYGDTGNGDPGFQIYYLDDNAYLQEADKKSFWTRGRSRAEVVVKTDRPYRTMQVTLKAGAVPTTSTIRVGGRDTTVNVGAGQSAIVRVSLGPGFPYKMDRETPAYTWVMSISSSSGFVPVLEAPGSPDRRYLGVLVRPMIVE